VVHTCRNALFIFFNNTPSVCFLRGANVGPVLAYVGLPESIVGLLGDSSSGYALTAYAMYKVSPVL